MRGFITIAVLVTLFAVTSSSYVFNLLMTEKVSMPRMNLNGEVVRPELRSHGVGLTDGQERQALNYIDQAYQSQGNDTYQNSIVIQNKIEDSFSGRWNV
jgi:hypothetical protein